MPQHGEQKFSRKQVERALKAVLDSDGFANSQQLSDFLKFIVTKTLDNQQSDIKAYTIAVDALGRNEDFDPQSNAAVRVAAGRLRQTLALYNAQPQPAEITVRIVLAPGSYVPTFQLLADAAPQESKAQEPLSETLVENELSENSEPLPALPGSVSGAVAETVRASLPGWFPKIAALICLSVLAVWLGVVALRVDDQLPNAGNAMIDVNLRPRVALSMRTPDDNYPDWFRVAEVRDSISHAMSRFDDYQYIGVLDEKNLENDDSNDPDYLLTVTAYSRGDAVRMFGELHRQSGNMVLWTTQRYFEKPTSLSARNLIAIAGSSYAPVGSPYGVIYADLLKGNAPRKGLDCFTATYQYFSRKTDQGHAYARQCAEDLIERGSVLPTVYAMLTFLYLDEIRENRNRRARNPMVAAEKVALRAVELGPQSPRAHQAVFAVRKVQRRFDEARKSAELAIRLNPYDTDILADYAAWLISIGETQKGNQILHRVQNLLDAHPAWLEAYRYLASELSGNTLQSDIIASSMDYERSPMTAASVIISAVRQGKLPRASQAILELKKTMPSMLDDPKQSYINRGFSDDVAETLATKLKQAQRTVEQAGK